MPERTRIHRTAAAAPLLLALGALAWLPARWGVMTTWDTTWLGLDYGAWNRLSLLPLGLLAVGAATASRLAAGRMPAVGWAVVAAGFALSWSGVALEFVVGGGLQGGPRDIAVAGWTLYLLGMAGTAVGSVVLAVSLRRRDPIAATAAGFGAAAFFVWPLLLSSGQDALAVADQLVVAIAWLALAARLQGSGAPQRVPAATG